jgi:hypothetical protein
MWKLKGIQIKKMSAIVRYRGCEMFVTGLYTKQNFERNFETERVKYE